MAGVFGHFGSGKTLMLTKFCKIEMQRGTRVLTNLKIEGTERISPEEFFNLKTEDEIQEKYSNQPEFDYKQGADLTKFLEQAGFIIIHSGTRALIAIDEIDKWADARRSGSSVNIDFDTVMTQSRKKGVSIVYTTQQPEQADKRIRVNTEVAIIAMKIKKKRTHELVKLYERLQLPTTDSSGKPKKSLVTGFKYIFSTDTNTSVKVLSIESAQQYFKLYNTFETIERPIFVDQALNLQVRFAMEAIDKRANRLSRGLDAEKNLGSEDGETEVKLDSIDSILNALNEVVSSKLGKKDLVKAIRSIVEIARAQVPIKIPEKTEQQPEPEDDTFDELVAEAEE